MTAFKAAAAEFAVQNSIKRQAERKEKMIESASDLCDLVEEIYMESCLKRPVKLPIIRMKELPLKNSDLEMYFMRKTTQLMMFQIDYFNFADAPELKESFTVWSQSIIKEIVEKAMELELNLMPKV